MKRVVLVITICIAMIMAVPVFADETSNEVIASITNYDVQFGSFIVPVEMGDYPILEYNGMMYLPLLTEYAKAMNWTVVSEEVSGVSVTSSEEEFVKEPLVNANSKHFKGEHVTVLLTEYDVRINDKSINQITDYPCITYNGITYIPAVWDVLVVNMGLNMKFEENKLFVFRHENETQDQWPCTYYIDYGESRYEGSINEALRPDGRGKIYNKTTGLTNEGCFQNGSFVQEETIYADFGNGYEESKGRIYYDVDYLEKTELNWKDRIWEACPASIIENSDERTIEISEQLSYLEERANQLKSSIESLSLDETVYWITGDVIYEDGEALYVQGQAFGFGAGFCDDALLKILKPYDGTNIFGSYSGTHVYVEEAFNGSEVIKVYKNQVVSDEVADMKTELSSVTNEIISLNGELEKIIGLVPWTERTSQIELRSGEYLFYNEDEKFTIKIPKRGKFSYSNTCLSFSSLEFSELQWKYPWGDPGSEFESAIESAEKVEGSDYYYKDDSRCAHNYIIIPELISEENGIKNAYAEYQDTYSYAILKILTEENAVITLKADMVDNIDEGIETLTQIGKTLVLFGN